MKNLIDLHIHTQASDGTDSIRELLTKIKQQGIRVFSVTDHDTVDGAREMAAQVDLSEIFISGVEFSCKTPLAKCHILGYWIDCDNDELQTALQEGERLRRKNLEVRLAFLKREWGIAFPQEAVDRLYAMKSVGKPHIAREMLKLGWGRDIDDAIQNYMNGCKVQNDRIDAEMAIHAIQAAGGIAVWAHPLGGEGSRHLSAEEFEKRLEVLRGEGIQGLECFYSRYSGEEAAYLRRRAESLGMPVSGGSDYHGENKTISLGELGTDGREIRREQITILSELGI